MRDLAVFWDNYTKIFHVGQIKSLSFRLRLRPPGPTPEGSPGGSLLNVLHQFFRLDGVS